MQDRMPGAPGQYILKISADEVQKLLVGENCTVVLTRDDHPIVEGTPLNKASFLPDDLAAEICPDIDDPIPADVFRRLAGVKTVLILSADGWNNNEQVVSVSGMTEESIVIVGPESSEENRNSYSANGVSCISQGTGTLTFKCSSVPAVDLVVNVALRV